VELVAVREADGEGLAYLVSFAKQGYIIEEGEAVRVEVNRALASDSWPEDVPELTYKLEEKFKKAIEQLKSDELYKSGRKLSQKV